MSVNTWILGKLQWEFNLPNAWQSTWKEERVLLIADTQGGPEGCLSPWDQPRDLSLYGCLWYILIGKLVYLVYTSGSKKRSQLPLKVVLVRGYAGPHSKIASIQLGESLWSTNISCHTLEKPQRARYKTSVRLIRWCPFHYLLRIG